MEYSSATFYDAVMPQHFKDGTEKALTVKEKANILDILTIQAGFYRNFKFISPVDLSPAGQTREYIVGTVFIPFRDQVILIP